MESLLKSNFSDANYVNDMNNLLQEYLQDYDASLDDKCFYCKACRTPTQRLLRCSGCQLMSYCDRDCQRGDWSNHKHICREFPVVNGRNALYTTGSWGRHLAELRKRAARLPKANLAVDVFQNPRVCHNCWKTGSESIKYCKCICVTYCSKICANADNLHKEKCEHFGCVLRLSYTMSIFNTLHKAHEAWERSQGITEGSFSAMKMVNLTIHVVDSSPIFDSRSWLGFLGSFPNLKKLRVVFVVQSKLFKPWFILNCENLMLDTGSITYSVQQMQYHMFFSSKEYTEPDFVVVFNNTAEMESAGDVLQSGMSYRNMIHSPKTILVLMDKIEELVRNGYMAVNAAQPVVQLVKPQVNPLKGTISDGEPDINYDCDFLKEMQYFTCLRRKTIDM